jgi:methyltransferase (TIGR00027 family)
LHRDGPPPRVLDDWLAEDLAGDEGRTIIDGMRASVTPARLHAFQAWTASRSRFVEDFVLSAVADGIDQYVLLGAGIDSFAHRYPDLVERLTIFEVDHPLSQAWKRQRLEELGISVPHNVVYAAADFETQSLQDCLYAVGFDFERPAVVSWIGVTMYLAHDAIVGTLNSVAQCAPGTRLVLSIDQPPEVLDDDGRELLADVRGAAARMGERFISLFMRDEMGGLLLEQGFDRVGHFGAPDATRRYFGDTEMGMPDVQRLVTAVVSLRDS